MKNVKNKMQNDKEKFKNDFKLKICQFVLHLIKFIDALPKKMVSEVMGKQLIQSSTSILANYYVEAKSVSSRKDFTNFFTYALISANESKLWLVFLKDIGKGDREKAERLF